MGTNYYLYEGSEACPTCKRPFEPLHIGKSSAGWCFSLHVIPEEGINTLDDWRTRWGTPGTIIRRSAGVTVTPRFFIVRSVSSNSAGLTSAL